MIDKIEIREADQKDIPVITDFNLALALDTEDLRLCRDQVTQGVELALARPELCRYYVATVAGRLVAQLMVAYEISDWLGGINWWINSVYVDPSYRGRGVYRNLYEHVRSEAERQGDVKRIRLYVERKNNKAIHVYQKIGMEPLNYHIYQEKI